MSTDRLATLRSFVQRIGQAEAADLRALLDEALRSEAES
jgi:hypothetical protein